MAIEDQILGIASSQNWLALGINLILATIIGGIVVIILLAVAGRAFGERVKYQNAFLMVFIINIINLFGILAFLSFLGPLIIILPAVIWIVFTKAFFSEMVLWHAVVIGIVGYALSIFLIPNIVAGLGAYLPPIGF